MSLQTLAPAVQRDLAHLDAFEADLVNAYRREATPGVLRYLSSKHPPTPRKNPGAPLVVRQPATSSKPAPPPPDSDTTDAPTDDDLPRAIALGSGLELAGHKITCAVLEDGRRVVAERSVLDLLGTTYSGQAGRLAVLAAGKRLKPFADAYFGKLGVPFVRFRSPEGRHPVPAYDSRTIVNVLRMLRDADRAGALMKQQKHLAYQADVVICALVGVGFDALIDDGSGYTKQRSAGELQERFVEHGKAEVESRVLRGRERTEVPTEPVAPRPPPGDWRLVREQRLAGQAIARIVDKIHRASSLSAESYAAHMVIAAERVAGRPLPQLLEHRRRLGHEPFNPAGAAG